MIGAVRWRRGWIVLGEEAFHLLVHIASVRFGRPFSVGVGHG
ncbi:hypothetical protein [Streptomyces sp. MNU89]|nr:hypothetical protein [Streptomyces sp. MNU89]